MADIKEKVIKMIRDLPEDVSLDEIMAELYFGLQVDAGLKELDKGKGIPYEEVEKRMSKIRVKDIYICMKEVFN
jgi:predicted transcriptional regulator